MKYRVILLIIILLLLSSPVFAQRLFYGFEEDREGWEDLFMTGMVFWDATLGLPPGSLRVTSTFAKSPCFPAENEGFWRTEVMAYNDGGLGCRITAEGYPDAACSNGASGTNAFGQTREDSTWVEIRFDFPLSALGPYVQLELAPLSSGDTCYFDNVRAVGPRSVTAVPTQSQYGLMLLAGVLGVAALLLIRRMHS